MGKGWREGGEGREVGYLSRERGDKSVCSVN